MNLPHQEEGTLVEDYDAPPLFRSIYLTEPGIYINKDGGRIRLNRGDEKLLDFPIEKIDQIVVTNEGAISFGALRALTDSQCSLVVHGLPGAPLVILQDAKQTQVELQHAQHLLIHNHERRISAARQIVKGKIKNQRLVLQRYFRVRGGLSKEVDIAMRNAVESANHCDTLDELRGHEGIAARAYFGALGVLLESSGFKFVGRKKRMAADPINALLSYCYGVLFQNILTLIHRRGLCPYTGCLHSLRQGHAALVSDLMEEFRPIVADSCVLRLIMQGRCKPSHFDLDDAFVKIPLELRKLLIQTLEDKLDQRLQVGNAEKPIDLRRRMQMQVNHWVDYLRGDASTYTPYTPR